MEQESIIITAQNTVSTSSDDTFNATIGLHFNKSWADVYLDDLAVNSYPDPAHDIGLLVEDSSPKSPACHTGTDKNGMIAARDFNFIEVVGDTVIKSSKSESILGELYFYSHLPFQLSAIFPAVYSVEYLPQTLTYTIKMERCEGLTFSHLLVGRSITKGRFLNFLTTLRKIHSAISSSTPCLPISEPLRDKFASNSIEAAKGGVNIYANYGSKLWSRYADYADKYNALGVQAAEIFIRLTRFLDSYESEERGVYTQVIHGDPVFSNAILSPDEHHVSFIDVRCQLNGTLTLEGDLNYDFAKVLQSLLGYDHAVFMFANLHQKPADQPLLDEAEESVLSYLRDIFWTFLETQYTVCVHKPTLLYITGSLFFTLIPLHKPELGQVFLRLCKSTLDTADRMSSGS
jgi:hypothetical protein